MIEQGTRFSYFTVSSDEQVTDNKRKWISVVCDCGARCTRRLDHLMSGRTKSCKSCSAKRTAKEHPMPSSANYCGDLGKTFFSRFKIGADLRGLSFNITQEYVWDLFVKQNYKCALSGVPINLSTKIRNSAPDYSVFTASLDRIDSSIGYEVGNVRWVHKAINRLKTNMSDEDFITWCSLVCNHANQQPSTGNEMQDVPVKVQRLGGEDSTNNPPKSVRQLCGTCKGSGIVSWHELQHYNGPALYGYTDDTWYTCEDCVPEVDDIV